MTRRGAGGGFHLPPEGGSTQPATTVDQLTGQEKLVGELCLPTFTGDKEDFQKMIQTIVANHPSEIK